MVAGIVIIVAKKSRVDSKDEKDNNLCYSQNIFFVWIKRRIQENKYLQDFSKQDEKKKDSPNCDNREMEKKFW